MYIGVGDQRVSQSFLKQIHSPGDHRPKFMAQYFSENILWSLTLILVSYLWLQQVVKCLSLQKNLLYNNKTKSQEKLSSALQQSINWIKFIKCAWLYWLFKGEVIFKKHLTVGLPEVAKLTDSARSKIQGDERKHSFLAKKKLYEMKNGFTMNT